MFLDVTPSVFDSKARGSGAQRAKAKLQHARALIAASIDSSVLVTSQHAVGGEGFG